MTETTVDRSAFAVTITATTEVDASADRVWEVLTDTESYPEWNPFVRRLEGELVVGSRLEVDLQAGAKKPMTIRPTVVEVEPGRRFAWLGRLGVRGLLDGRHVFEVTPAGPDHSILVQHERLAGVLAPALRRLLTVDTPRGFGAANDALAARATVGRSQA